MSDSPYIANVTQATFETDVIQRSMDTLVLVDFWAGWCNPCKLLMPVLAQLAAEYDGKFFLAKVDTDTERALAEQYGIRSLPTVRLFKQGQVVDEFNGAIPASQVKEFIDRNLFKVDDFDLQNAREAIEKGDLEAANTLLLSILENSPDNFEAQLLQMKVALQKNDYEQVDKLINLLPINKIDNEQVKEIKILNEFGKATLDSPGIERLRSQIDLNNDVAARYRLACHLAFTGEFEEALAHFFKILEEDRQFNDEGARKSMIAIFDLLGSSGPLVNQYRIKMSRLLH